MTKKQQIKEEAIKELAKKFNKKELFVSDKNDGEFYCHEARLYFYKAFDLVRDFLIYQLEKSYLAGVEDVIGCLPEEKSNLVKDMNMPPMPFSDGCRVGFNECRTEFLLKVNQLK